MEYPNKPDSYFLPLNDYTKFAKQSIRRFMPVLANVLLRDDDFVSDITHDIMMADWRWNGNGSRVGYRSKCAKWSILDKLKARNRVIPTFSLDQPINNKTNRNNDRATVYYEILEDKKRHGEITEDHLKNFSLTENQIHLLLRNINGESITEIAKSQNISNQAVSLTIKVAKEKIRKYYDKENIL